MKVKFRHAVKAFHGSFKAEGLVYCRYNDGALYRVRKYPKYTASVQNHKVGDAGRNLGKLYKSISDEYKNDLNTYAKLMTNYTNLADKSPANGYAHYLKMMWKLKSQFPEIDLVTLTREDILKHEYPARTIVEAMKAGILFEIEEAKMLTQLI